MRPGPTSHSSRREPTWFISNETYIKTLHLEHQRREEPTLRASEGTKERQREEG